MPGLDTSGYEFHEPPISWGRLTFGLGDDQVTLQIGKMLREAFDAGIKKSANTGVEGANCVEQVMEDIHGAVLGKDGRGKDAMVKEGFYTRITGAGAPAVLLCLIAHSRS